MSADAGASVDRLGLHMPGPPAIATRSQEGCSGKTLTGGFATVGVVEASLHGSQMALMQSVELAEYRRLGYTSVVHQTRPQSCVGGYYDVPGSCYAVRQMYGDSVLASRHEVAVYDVVSLLNHFDPFSRTVVPRAQAR